MHIVENVLLLTPLIRFYLVGNTLQKVSACSRLTTLVIMNQ